MTILIVDDSALIRQIIFNNLMKLGVRRDNIKEAQDGEHALKILATLKEVDLIFTDLMMPKIDGFELIKKIVKNQKFHKSVIVVISGSISQENKKSLDDLGVYGYVPKPFDKDKFMEVIEPTLAKIKKGEIATGSKRMESKELLEILGLQIEEARIEGAELVLDFGSKEIRIDAEKFVHLASVTNINNGAESSDVAESASEESVAVANDAGLHAS